MKNLGKFIVFEGIDGSGKTTNLKFVASLLRQQGNAVVETREPGGTELGMHLREILLNKKNLKVDSISELLLMFAARRQHIVDIILPALKQGSYVLCDRFTSATFAYQGGARGIANNYIKSLANIVQQGLEPDYTLLFDLPVNVAAKRVNKRGALDRFEREKQSFFMKVRKSYLAMAKANSNNYTVINATKSLHSIQQQLTKLFLC